LANRGTNDKGFSIKNDERVAEVVSTRDRNQDTEVRSVLHVEDDETISGNVKELLESEGWPLKPVLMAIALETFAGARNKDL
jgi:hypothetical protein